MDTGIPNTQKKIGRLKSLIFLLSFFYFSTAVAFAQQLSGSYTIGASGNYATFSDAVSDLTSNGISGPVTFEVQAGTYTEQILLGAISGASETNTITFQSESGNAGDVVIQYAATGTADNYVIRLDNSSHLIFRNLTIQSQGNGYSWTISAINELNDLLVEQCVLSAPDWNSRNFNAGNVRLNPSLSSNVRLINNRISGGDHGLYYVGGSSSSRSPGFELRDNEIAGPFAYGVYLQYLTGAVIEGNTVTMRGTSWSSSYSMKIDQVEDALRVVGNRLRGSNDEGLEITYSNGTAESPGLVANNWIQNKGNRRTVFLYYNSHLNFYHNSINAINGSGSAYSIQYDGAFGQSGNRIVNNIFKANVAEAVYVSNSNA
ncbi:hypothetical protein E4S40_15890, partial [Algoriphagus kandeliae]